MNGEPAGWKPAVMSLSDSAHGMNEGFKITCYMILFRIEKGYAAGKAHRNAHAGQAAEG